MAKKSKPDVTISFHQPDWMYGFAGYRAPKIKKLPPAAKAPFWRILLGEGTCGLRDGRAGRLVRRLGGMDGLHQASNAGQPWCSKVCKPARCDFGFAQTPQSRLIVSPS